MQRQVQKSILRYGHLRTHLLIYSEEKPHPCGPCEVSCREAESLNKHILHHSGENPHSCTECKKVFWQTGSISTHLLIHTGEKLHPCGQCDKSFTQAETLNKHLFLDALASLESVIQACARSAQARRACALLAQACYWQTEPHSEGG